MTVRIGNHRNSIFFFQGARIAATVERDRASEEEWFGKPRTPEKNPAMEFEVPEIPEDLRDWRNRLKPCNDLGDTFIPPDPDGPSEEKWDQELTREHRRFVEKRCKVDCPFLALCSRDAISAAQDFANFQGVAARLHGTWAGVTFTGREGTPQYRNKLSRIADQMNSGEVTWEPSSSFPTTHQNSNA